MKTQEEAEQDARRRNQAMANPGDGDRGRRFAIDRMTEKGEDGQIRSPIAMLFRNAFLTNIEDALTPVLPADQVGPVLLTTKLAAEQQLATQYPDLTCDMIQAIIAYTMELVPEEASVYWACNGALRAKDRSSVQGWVNYIYLLLTALSRLPPAPTLVVYRGYRKAHTELGKHFIKGGTVVFSGFTSAAINIEAMQDFVGREGPRTLVTLHLRQAPRSIADFSLYPSETEVVLPPNAIFKIRGIFHAGNDLVMMDLHQEESIDELLKFD